MLFRLGGICLQKKDKLISVTIQGELGNRGGQYLKIWYEKSSPSSNGIVHLEVIGGRFATDTAGDGVK